MTPDNSEKLRLEEDKKGLKKWKKWGPYVSDRQWGTVREDYSDHGNAWAYFTHDQARSRAYKWGEDGLCGISDDQQRLCFAMAMWNGKDPILKERLFGLANNEGNHGEDVKECYYYLDNTPTHSYMKFLYKYPQNTFPYDDLVKTNRERGKRDREYEILETGIFDKDEYFDVFIEYAKAGTEDLLIRVTAMNRSNSEASLSLLPTLWFRNIWQETDAARPVIKKASDGSNSLIAFDSEIDEENRLENFVLEFEGDCSLLFTNNETNKERIFNTPNDTPYVKDGINDFVIHGKENSVNPELEGTKAAALYRFDVPAGEQVEIRMRLSVASEKSGPGFGDFQEVFERRIAEADAFYEDKIPQVIRDNEGHYALVRQAFAGMLWTKQFYYYDVAKWVQEHGIDPFSPHSKESIRNKDWHHMETRDIISMPDKWEYPWFAAWDLAFHMFPFESIDPEFAKHQLDLMLRSEYIHPNGQIPAYEWNFSDVNPPVHAWATIQVYLSEKRNNKRGDYEFLGYCFGKLLLNFMWWVNRKDPEGNNLFQGGFLGLDNIGVFDRSAELPTGGKIEQADGTAWMAFYSMQMLRISLELAKKDEQLQAYVYKFFTHAMLISSAMSSVGESNTALWDEEDGFFYDLLHFPDGSTTPLKIRSLVGLLPLMSVCVFPDRSGQKFPELMKRLRGFSEKYASMMEHVHTAETLGSQGTRMIALVNERRLRLILKRMLDENEFLSPHGIRSLSLHHKDHPYEFHWNNEVFRVEYLPAESDSSMFGGNSNWRGPVWIPVNVLLIHSLMNYYSYYGDDFKIECPTGSGNEMNLLEVAKFISKRIIDMFLPGEDGARPIHGRAAKYKDDPHWKDLILFYEYFNGDNGEGLGASHQTGWTGGIVDLIGVLDLVSSENIQEFTNLSTGTGK